MLRRMGVGLHRWPPPSTSRLQWGIAGGASAAAGLDGRTGRYGRGSAGPAPDVCAGSFSPPVYALGKLLETARQGEKALSVYYASFRPELERLKRSTDRDREKAVKLGLIQR
jgi:hypothetical protein